MPLISLADVKARFKKIDLFLEDVDADLPGCVQAAERELARYYRATDPLSERMDGLLMALIQKHIFDVPHGDTEFDHRPQILRDYDSAIADLRLVRSGDLDPDETTEREDASPAIESKPRRFGVWFRD